MAKTRIITLTDKGTNSGPYYALYTSIDCNVYTFQENVFLPSIGSSIVVDIPDNDECVKLISLGVCTNEVVQVDPLVNEGDFYLLDWSYLDFNVF